MQLFESLSYLHKANIVHGKISLNHILIQKQENGGVHIKLSGFSQCKILPNVDKDDDLGFDNQEAGCKFEFNELAVQYQAPEVLKQQDNINQSSDVWSACVTLFILHQAQYPFKGQDREDVLNSIRCVNMPNEFSSQKWLHVTRNAKDFMFMGLKISPYSRLNCNLLLLHPWLNKQESLPPLIHESEDAKESVF